jgi:hypothetical protein
LNRNNIPARAKLIPLAATITASLLINPYAIHNPVPAANDRSILRDRSSVCPVRQHLRTCGRFENAVSPAAANPIRVAIFNIVTNGHDNISFRHSARWKASHQRETRQGSCGATRAMCGNDIGAEELSYQAHRDGGWEPLTQLPPRSVSASAPRGDLASEQQRQIPVSPSDGSSSTSKRSSSLRRRARGRAHMRENDRGRRRHRADRRWRRRSHPPQWRHRSCRCHRSQARSSSAASRAPVQ